MLHQYEHDQAIKHKKAIYDQITKYETSNK